MSKTVSVSNKTWERLTQIKFKKKFSNMDLVIKYILDKAKDSNDPDYAALKSFFTSNKAKKSGKNGKSSKTSNF